MKFRTRRPSTVEIGHGLIGAFKAGFLYSKNNKKRLMHHRSIIFLGYLLLLTPLWFPVPPTSPLHLPSSPFTLSHSEHRHCCRASLKLTIMAQECSFSVVAGGTSTLICSSRATAHYQSGWKHGNDQDSQAAGE